MWNYETDHKNKFIRLSEIGRQFLPPTEKVYHSDLIFSFRDKEGRDHGFYVEDHSLPETVFGFRGHRFQTLEEAQKKEHELLSLQ